MSSTPLTRSTRSAMVPASEWARRNTVRAEVYSSGFPSQSDGDGAGLFQADDELGRVGAPVDGNHVGALMRCRHLVHFVGDDHRHRYDEILAEVPARIAGDGVRHLADQVLDVLVAGVGFLHS